LDSVADHRVPQGNFEGACVILEDSPILARQLRTKLLEPMGAAANLLDGLDRIKGEI
jgi:hypothetical protein